MTTSIRVDRAHPPLVAGDVADGVAHRLATSGRHAPRRRPGGQSTRLQQDDAARRAMAGRAGGSAPRWSCRHPEGRRAPRARRSSTQRAGARWRQRTASSRACAARSGSRLRHHRPGVDAARARTGEERCTRATARERAAGERPCRLAPNSTVATVPTRDHSRGAHQALRIEPRRRLPLVRGRSPAGSPASSGRTVPARAPPCG